MAFEQEHIEACRSAGLITSDSKIRGDFYVERPCQLCGKPKGSIHRKNPRKQYCWSSSCLANKSNGGLDLTKHFGLILDYSKKYPSTKTNPTRTIDEWLVDERKIPRKLLDGFKRQQVTKEGSVAAVFSVGIGVDGKETFNGRWINTRAGQEKGYGWGKQKGLYGKHQGKKYNEKEEVWVVEGAIDCLSLWAFSIQAIWVFSSNANPQEIDLHLFKKLVCLFDNDPSGRACMKRFLKVYPDATALLLDPGVDANDILKKYGSEKGAEYIKRNRKRFRINAMLATVNSPIEYAKIWQDFYKQPPGLFTHRGSTWFGYALKKKGQDTDSPGHPTFDMGVELVLKGVVDVLSFLIDTSDPVRPDFCYNLQMTPADKRPARPMLATGEEIGNAGKLIALFHKQACITFQSSRKDVATAFACKITESNAPVVRVADLLGLDKESNTYLFHKWAITNAGRLITPNKKGFFEISHQDYVLPAYHASNKAITPSFTEDITLQEIYTLIYKGWGKNGIIAFSWLVGSWFVSSVKTALSFFVHLSIFGDPGAGKSALVTILNACQSISAEGIPLTSTSTKKGILRSISRSANLANFLLEGNDRAEAGKAFDYGATILTGYNKDNDLQTSANFSMDKRTVTYGLPGTIAFVSNSEEFESQAERERILSLKFNLSDLTPKSRAAYSKLANTPLPQLARVILQTLRQRKKIENGWQEVFNKTCREMLGEVNNIRILQNYALVASFHSIFCTTHKIKKVPGIQKHLTDLANEKEITSSVTTYNHATHFFELLDHLDEEKSKGCLHVDTDTNKIYINLTGAERVIRSIGYQFAITKDLIKDLRPLSEQSSLNFRFPNDPNTGSDGRPKMRRVWKFDAQKLANLGG